jgi:hypothetical protein
VALEAGYRAPGVFGGGFVEVGEVWQPGCVGSACSGFDVTFGLVGRWHPRRGATLDPWLGGGLGIESIPGAVVGCGCVGFAAMAGVGLDVRLGSHFALGPVAGVRATAFIGGDGNYVAGWDAWFFAGGRIVGDLADVLHPRRNGGSSAAATVPGSSALAVF